MIDLPALVRPLEGSAHDLGRIEALGQEIGDPARRRLVGGEARDDRLGRWWWICFGRWSQRFMHGGGGNFHRNYPPVIGDSSGRMAAPNTDTNYSPGFHTTPMDTDKIACAEVDPGLGLCARPGPLGRSHAICHPGAEIAVSWFRGPYPSSSRTAGAIRRRQRGQAPAWPARVAVNGDRATAETNVAILVRQTIEGVGGRSHLERTLPRPASRSATATGAWSSARRCTRRIGSIRSSRRQSSTR